MLTGFELNARWVPLISAGIASHYENLILPYSLSLYQKINSVGNFEPDFRPMHEVCMKLSRRNITIGPLVTVLSCSTVYLVREIADDKSRDLS